MKSSKRQARQERRRAQQTRNQMRWLVYIALGAIVLLGLIILSQQASGPRQSKYSQENGMSLGDPNAPVTLVEFADFQCPHCYNQYNTTEPSIIEQYVDTGKVNYTYQIVAFLGQDSVYAAEGAYCAADQNLFWEYHDVIFAPSNFSGGNTGGYSKDRLISMAGQINGINIDAFSQCLQNDDKLQTIQDVHDLGDSVGVTATPGFVINGTVAIGEKSFTQLQQIIESALAAAGAN